MNDYQKFKKKVIENAGYECEMCHTSEGLTVHHMLKQSTFPQYRLDPDNGVCLCGCCHSEVERRRREGDEFFKYFPRRLCRAHEKFKVTWRQLGVVVPEAEIDD